MDWRQVIGVRARAFGSMLPVLAVAVVFLTASTDFFPDTAFFPGVTVIGAITPLRLVVIASLIALVASGARLSTFRTRIDVFIAVLILVSTAGVVLRHWPAGPLRDLFVEVAVFYLAVGVRRVYSEAWAPVAMIALLAVAAAGLVAFAQVANQTPTGYCGGGFLGDVQCGHGAIIRAEGTFSNPNELAAFLLLLAPVATRALDLVSEKLTRSVVLGIVVVGWAAVLTTFSRTAYVAMLVSLALVASAPRLLSRLTRTQLTMVISGGALVLAASSVIMALLWRHDESLGLRDKAWVTALRLARSHPLLGEGIGRAGTVVSAVTGEEFAHVHNLWLNWLVETGVPGLVAITAITVIGLVSAARQAARASPINTAELAGLTGFLLMSLTDDPANLSRIAMAMWMVLGSILADTPARWRDVGPVTPRDEEDGLDLVRPEDDLLKIGVPGDSEDRTRPLPVVSPALDREGGAGEARTQRIRMPRKPPPPEALRETRQNPRYPPPSTPAPGMPPPQRPSAPGRPTPRRRPPTPPPSNPDPRR